ncbi:hypothetical protein POTOM_002115 [Populus tomentosa]|uniref:Stomatal closure-related actin-binding protein 1 n=1 Tax=Populus tomentosa TaxID=118781 RepID=A0A8X8IZD2_POPTO|nr:hypothetical protein POTOM_002115 [Populus tomentosa]
MTRVTRDFGDTMQKDAVLAVSADVAFASSRFPNYKIGATNQILDAKDDPKVLSMKEVVARETALLLEQQKRLSVRDLASKFEKGLAAAAKLSEEARLREAASLEKHVLLKKLRDALESLKGRVAGRNKDDVEEAIAMVEALAVQLTQREGELIQEKSEVKKLANFLKQASEDAKKLVDEERAYARAEIESARATVQRVEEALQEHERMSRALGKQDLEELMKEVQEARRIKMLHQPSKVCAGSLVKISFLMEHSSHQINLLHLLCNLVMDMEHELRALRMQLAEKSKCSLQLQKELARSRRGEQSIFHLFELDGSEALGSCLRINPCSDNAPELSECSIQWYRLSSEDVKKALISGATKPVYAPEPFDVGRVLQAEIISDGQQFTLTTTCAIDPAAGLGSYVEALVRKHDVEFNVVVTQMNGLDHTSESIHVLHVGKMRMKLRKGKSTIAKEYYSTSMQLCGVRGGGNAAAQALFWQAKKGVSFVLAFESARERNAAIMLARRFAFDCNIMLAGPDDRAPLGS